MTKQVVIDITAAGSVKVDAQNFNGNGCAKATEQIELAIGGTAAKKKTPKPEFYKSAGSANNQNKQVF